MELVHLHVFQGNASAVGYRHTVTHAGEGIAGDTPGTSIATGCEQNSLGVEG